MAKNMVAKGNNAENSYYWCTQDSPFLTNIEPYKDPSVVLPDTGEIPPINEGIVSLSGKLSKKVQTATILLVLRRLSLISLG